MSMRSSCIMRLLLLLSLLSILERFYVQGGLYWHDQHYLGSSPRTCEYDWLVRRLMGIPWGWDWMNTCEESAGIFEVGGGQYVEFTRPDWCEHHGVQGVYGLFHFPQKQCASLVWGSWRNEGCASRGLSRRTSVLWNIDEGNSWENTCWQTETNSSGLFHVAPALCENSGLNIWGVVFHLDSTCCSKLDSQLGQSLEGNEDQCILGPNGGGGIGNPPFPNNNPFTPVGTYIDTDENLVAQLKKSTLTVLGVVPDAESHSFILTAVGDSYTLTVVDPKKYEPSRIIHGILIPRGDTVTSGNVVQSKLTVDMNVRREREFFVTPLFAEGQQVVWGFNSALGLWHGAIIPTAGYFTFRDLRLSPGEVAPSAIFSTGTIGPGPGYVVAWVNQVGSRVYNLYVYFQSQDGTKPECLIFQYVANI